MKLTLSKFRQLSKPWKANCHSNHQDIPRLLWDTKVIKVFTGELALADSPIHFTPLYPIFMTHLLLSYLRLCVNTYHFPSGFQTDFKRIYQLSHACYMIQPRVTIIVIDEEHKSWRCSTCSDLLPPLTSPHRSKNLFSSDFVSFK
jgi:hypothetical protein